MKTMDEQNVVFYKEIRLCRRIPRRGTIRDGVYWYVIVTVSTRKPSQTPISPALLLPICV